MYHRYSGKCFAFIRSMIKDDEVSKDLVHDIFVKVWLRREIISKVDSFSSYLFRMAKNAVLDYYDSNAINRRYVARQLLCQEEFRPYVEEKVNLDDLQLLVYSVVGQMPEQRRRIFTLSRYKGIPNSEIARMLGINIRTVENHISNALADIRAALAQA
ncbi:MAG: RNA polymerase sigma-70 factor [Bacteroidales bacterium]|nr:RNA polymerase sigma-70 factor [Bacteroidales bacterium]MDE7127689.1 RNA polymerase sigma-70 factor [Bacteroidales bacterium]